MTSNQISYAALGETKRHNQATEEAAEEANRIQHFIAETDRAYKENSLYIQDKYKALENERETALGQRKLDIEQQLADLRGEQQRLDEWYKSEMDAHDSIRLDIEKRQQEATQKYQEKMAALGYDKNEIERYSNYIKEKQTEYQKYATDLNYQAETARIDVLRQQNILTQQRQDWQRNLELYQYKADLMKFNTNTKLQGLNIGTGFVSNLGKTISSLFR